MRLYRPKIFFLFLLVLTAEVSAQNESFVEILPGTALVQGINIEPYTARWRQWVTAPDGSERAGVNTIYDSVSVSVVSDTMRMIVRDMLWEADSGTYQRIDVLDQASLAPVHMHVRVSPYSVTHVDFKGRHIRGLSIDDPRQSAIRTEGTIERPAFNWSSDGFLLAALSLPDVGEVRLPVVTNLTNMPAVTPMTFKVVGREQVDTLPFGTHDTVVVKQTGSTAYWGMYWISKKSPYVVQVQFTQQDGTVTTWELF